MSDTPHSPSPDGTVAIVTGATCGDGGDLVAVLTSRGLAVVVAYLRDPRAADAVVDRVLAAQGSALPVRADLTDLLDVERLFDETVAAFGAVHAVVHAAVRGAAEVLGQAARTLPPGGLVVRLTGAGVEAVSPALVAALRARGVIVDTLERAGDEPAEARLGELMDRWRAAQGPDQGVHGCDRGTPDAMMRTPDDPRRPTMTTDDIGTLATLLHETAEHHDHFEKTSPPHDWWDWYAPYLAARQEGKSSDEATAAADRYMAEVHHVVAS